MTEGLDVVSGLVSQYLLRDRIGEGGFAVVYRAQSASTGHDVALKVLKTDVPGGRARERFRREIAALGRLSHPHIASLLDTGEWNGQPFLVMPWIDGVDCAALLKRDGPLGVERLLELTRAIGGALAYAHDAGTVHRDITPSNILWSGDGWQLVDFGLALGSESDQDERVTSTGAVVGTSAYMSPEQVSGSRTIDGRSDQYSFACVLYEMLAGVPPFVAGSGQAARAMRLYTDAPNIQLHRPGLPQRLSAAITRALAREPADRFASMSAFLTALDEDLPQGHGYPSGAHRAWRAGWKRVHVSALGPRVHLRRLITLSAILSVLGVAGWTWSRLREAVSGDPAWPVTAVAVLPINDLTPDGSYKWLSDGLTNEVIDALASVQQLDVRTFEAASAAVETAGSESSTAQDLRVGTFVSGTLESQNDSLLLSVRLADAATARALGAPIRVRTSLDRADDLRSQLVDGVMRELRQILGQRIEAVPSSASSLGREAWDAYRRAEALAQRVRVAIAEARGRSMVTEFRLADSLYLLAAHRSPQSDAPVLGRGWLYEHYARFVSDTAGNRCESACVEWRDRALRILDGIRDTTPDVRALRASIWLELARAPALEDSARGLLERAEGELVAAIREDSLRPSSWIALATLRSRQGLAADAVAALEYAQRADPWLRLEPDVMERWETNLRVVGRLDEAQRMCALGRARYPSRVSFQDCRLIHLGERGRGVPDVEAAWGELEATVLARPDTSADVTWWFRRAMVAAVLARSGLADSARHVLAESRRLRPTSDVNLYFQEAFVHLQFGDTSQTLNLLKRYLELAPSRAELLARARWFAALLPNPRFQELLARARERQ